MITAHPPSASEMLRFLDFPREIRDKIYAECLVVEKLYPYIEQERRAWTDTIHDELPFLKERTSATASDPRPFGASPSDPRPPSASNAGINLNLLLTNRMIYAEASKILFCENTFVMPTWHFMSKFFNIYAGKDQLTWIKSIELIFYLMEPYAAPGRLAIDRVLSPREKDILRVDIPQRQSGTLPPFAWMLRHEFNRHRPSGRQDLLIAWLRKAMLAKSLSNCHRITLHLNEASYLSYRLDEYVLWPFVMPPIITVRPSGWAPRLPAGIRVEGLPQSLSLQTALENIQGYRLQGMSLIPARPRS